jgi:hypothetical protein
MRGVKTLLVVGLCLLAGACGVKPGSVSAPEGVEHDRFPRTYPDLSTDPAPEQD